MIADPSGVGCWVPHVTRPPDPLVSCGPELSRDRISCVACATSSDPGCMPSP
ncbi:MAG TPA: hypothetical protein VMT03_22155 [Polyangia bacterium]|nr:hypothetical protein [Polyangia bacterium]